MIKINGIPIQNGRVTHHHDQSITLHSLSPTKRTPRSPITLIDELDELSSAIVLNLVIRTYFLVQSRRQLTAKDTPDLAYHTCHFGQAS